MFINLYIDLYGVAVRDLYRLVATYIVVLEGGYCTWSQLSLVVSFRFAFLLVKAKLFTIPFGHLCKIWQRLVNVVGLATLFLNVDLCKCCSRFCIDNVYYDNIIPHRCYNRFQCSFYICLYNDTTLYKAWDGYIGLLHHLLLFCAISRFPTFLEPIWHIVPVPPTI